MEWSGHVEAKEGGEAAGVKRNRARGTHESSECTRLDIAKDLVEELMSTAGNRRCSLSSLFLAFTLEKSMIACTLAPCLSNNQNAKSEIAFLLLKASVLAGTKSLEMHVTYPGRI